MTADGGRGAGASTRPGGGASGFERVAAFASGVAPNFLGSVEAAFGASFEEEAAGTVAGAGDGANLFVFFMSNYG
jgi:hypothetical protein